jgi:hypothetical protein
LRPGAAPGLSRRLKAPASFAGRPARRTSTPDGGLLPDAAVKLRRMATDRTPSPHFRIGFMVFAVIAFAIALPNAGM